MSFITIEKATIADAEKLTEIMKKTFDEEARKWLPKKDIVSDYNILPPGYSSNEMTKYMIRELEYFKVLHDNEVIGGIIITISGKSFGRIDRIFVDPNYQGKGIGSKAINFIEEAFPYVRTWDLETSSKQINNHYFYEKMGYRTTFESEDEYGFQKKIGTPTEESLVENKNISSIQYVNCEMANTDYYDVNLEGSSFSNSNLMNSHISNCNLSHSKFQNINLRNSLYADLNLSNSEMIFVTLGGVRFSDTNLGDENIPISFERCDLEGSKFCNSNLRNVEIQKSDLTGMKIDNVPVEDLFEAYYQMNKSKQ
ncbi:GNAT family N-acetyltransferase [Sporosarcina thermotolerans]|uniref:GNAT family N-acetyltransferase n=1 Tax=Sporosarcina thermotolerans TaxID=633404 RepID=A0AAW9AE97_9BACL|nr:GNAT family N-acetyltransferase [Sporosarcina thermotolerans]MDW0117468.1 GNAT family N-acetyltransferase [Sporosarcina thermotolerans]WHT49643.1 GNAT family N-acetyltransferase [Sporosarcina thermotolerans]